MHLFVPHINAQHRLSTAKRSPTTKLKRVNLFLNASHCLSLIAQALVQWTMDWVALASRMDLCVNSTTWPSSTDRGLATATADFQVHWQERPIMTPQYCTIPQGSRYPLDGRLIIMNIINPERYDLFLSELKATQDIIFLAPPVVPLLALPLETVGMPNLSLWYPTNHCLSLKDPFYVKGWVTLGEWQWDFNIRTMRPYHSETPSQI